MADTHVSKLFLLTQDTHKRNRNTSALSFLISRRKNILNTTLLGCVFDRLSEAVTQTFDSLVEYPRVKVYTHSIITINGKRLSVNFLYNGLNLGEHEMNVWLIFRTVGNSSANTY